MFNFISKRKHEEIVDQKDAEIEQLTSERDFHLMVTENAGKVIPKLTEDNRSVRRQLAEALSELHALKAKRARANANLIPGGAKVKARVMAARAQQKEVG
jgi:hypothetical protein